MSPAVSRRRAPLGTAPGLILLFVWAAWERFRLPLAPCADPDIWVYLGPGLDKLLGAGFSHVYGQCFLYPGFVYAVVKIAGDYRVVTLVQHLLGLGTGALLYACWEQWRRLLPVSRVPGPLFRLAGGLLAGVYLLSGTAVEFEHALRPEAIFPFFVVLNIYGNLRFIRARFVDGSSRHTLFFGGLAMFCSAAACLLKPGFAGALVPANLPLIVSLFRPGQSARGKGVLAGVPALVVALLLVWPEQTLRQRDTQGELFVARSLFTVHANFINDQMAADLARPLAATAYPRDFTAAAHAALTEALRESRAQNGRHWPALGFNADYLVYGQPSAPSFTSWVSDQLHGDAAEAAFYRYYYRRTLRQHPAWFAAKVLRQCRAFYRFGDCPVYAPDAPRPLREAYRESADALATNYRLGRYPPGNDLLLRSRELRSSPLQIGPFPWTEAINAPLAWSYFGWCLGAVGLAVVVWKSRYCRSAFGGAAPVLVWLFAYNLGTVLTLAFTHSLDVGRYSRYQLAYTLLPEFGAVWLAVEAAAVAAYGLARPPETPTRFTWKEMKSPWMSKPFSASETIATDGLPRLGPVAAEPSIGAIILARTRPGEEYRAAFPGARVVSMAGDEAGGEILAALDQADGDALVFIDADAGHPVEAARQLMAAFAAAPSDLLVGCGNVDRPTVSKLSALVLSVAFGWSSYDPLSGLWLCSRRLYRHASLSTGDSQRGVELDCIVQAFDRGFSVRETPLSSATAASEMPRSTRSEPDSWLGLGRLLRGLAAGCIFARPLRLLGGAGIALVFLGLILGYAPLRHVQKKSQASPARLIVSFVLLTAGLLSVQTGLLLEAAARRNRAALQLRLRHDPR